MKKQPVIKLPSILNALRLIGTNAINTDTRFEGDGVIHLDHRAPEIYLLGKANIWATVVDVAAPLEFL